MVSAKPQPPLKEISESHDSTAARRISDAGRIYKLCEMNPRMGCVQTEKNRHIWWTLEVLARA